MKKKLAKILAITLSLIMILTIIAACNGDADPDSSPTPGGPDDPTSPGPGDPVDPDRTTFSNITTKTDVEPLGVEPTRQNTLIVGYNAPALGDFIGGFSIGAYDQTIWRLLHGMALVQMFDPAGEIYINPTVVADHEISEDAEGNKTYTFTINKGLLWSDGTEISAFDYVTSVLWSASPQWQEADAGWDAGSYIEFVGHTAYHEGESEYFKGVRLLDDYKFSVTISHEELPYFFDLAMVAFGPTPAHVYIPGMTITSDENGSKFDGDITDNAHEIATTFRFAPTVVSGPYTFVSFENRTVTVQRNPAFGGDSKGRMPTIDFIQQIETNDETDIDQLFAGEVDLHPDELDASKIERVLAHNDFTHHEYLRFGYGVVNFQHYGGTHGADPNMRWAIAHLMDRQAVLDQVLGGRGSLIDTEASPGQWMWQARGAEALSVMRPIALSIDSANEFLDKTDYKFEADGTTPWDADKANEQGTYLRHNSDGDPLIWRNGGAAPSVSNAIEVGTAPRAALAGMQFTSEFVDWDTIVGPNMNAPWTIPDDELIFSSFSMGWGFGATFDPYYYMHSSFNGTAANPAFADDIIDEAIVRMRRSDPTDYEGFLNGWFDYIVRFNEVLPSLPLYNNMWMDLYNPRVGGVENVTDLASWAAVITQLTLS
ncbi:MAG: ABC transporter substrate-binding protein [Oscillospiraceae bacterium]|jgi:peptide/nickel transport system substrate-binding protein|nr:ABC transporter substrate-binding protein [Oscillospiraceae bacterium]